MSTETDSRARRQAGFTLIELVVAMGAAIAVVSALVTLLIVTLHDSQQTLGRVDATRQARTVIATVDNELHSACVGANSQPIQASSTANALDFISYTGDSLIGYAGATATPLWHEIAFSGGKLTDTTWATTQVVGSDGTTSWQQTGSGTVRTLLSNVSQNGTTPIFQYFAYQGYQSTSNSSLWYWTVPDGTNPQPSGTNPQPASTSPMAASSVLTGNGALGALAANVVEVGINLTVVTNVVSGTGSNPTTPLSDLVSLRLTTPPDSSTSASDVGDYGPCE